jgi:ABC-type transport system involved in cytochrome bd biosynthesis fused ATPase/permease subunit
MPDFRVNELNISSTLAAMQCSFSFFVPAQSGLGISGASGIGKSILLKALADMLPHQGELFLDDIESQTLLAPQWRKKVGLLPAESQWWNDRVGDHFHCYDDELFPRLGFDKKVMAWHISHLSSGEKQRLACIRLLMNQPEVLLLDEPTANLDHTNRENLEHLLLDYQIQQQCPLIMISHDNEQLAKMCQQLLILQTGHYEIKALNKGDIT